jgi:glutamyl-tRNA synthetase
MTVRTRFAPSPTGYLHLGGARTALFSWLYARQAGGVFLLRIEDTDPERSDPRYSAAILDSLQWLGLDWDEGPIYQSSRLERYREVAEALLRAGRAYRCYCTPEELEAMRAEQTARGLKPRYDGRCRTRHEPRPGVRPVVRFRTPETGSVGFTDLVRGAIRFENAELDDLVLLRSDGSPTYNFGVVVDDHDMGVTHVVRGDDHINNTPRQIHLFEALGAPLPAFAHVPMILGPDGTRLSKRHGAVSVGHYRDQGYLPEALLNVLVRLGWSHGDQEIFSREEMIALFSLERVQRSAAVFDPKKLDWLNQHYLRTLPAERVRRALAPFLEREGLPPPVETPVWFDALRSRARTLAELAAQARIFYARPTQYDPEAVRRHLDPRGRALLADLAPLVSTLASWSPEDIHKALGSFAEVHGLKLGAVAQPLRVALTGTAVSPPIDVLVAGLGRDETLARLAALPPPEAEASKGAGAAPL